jgi:hypothetical protein
MNLRSLTFLGLSLLSTVFAGTAQAANPMGLAYSSTTNVSLYGKSTGVMVTGRCNRYNSAFATVRSKGGEVLAYLNPTARPDHYVCALDTGFYMNNLGAVPLWPYPSYGQRFAWSGTNFTDIRPGSKWILWVVSYVEKLMREGKVDGVFLDNVGARPWGQSQWNNWPQWEKDAWTDGNIDLVRRLDAKRRAIKPNFLIVNNNNWARGDTRGYAGEKYVDGICLEHPTLWVTAYHKALAGKAYSNLGHRRVIVVARSVDEARAWAGVKGVTHVSSQATGTYGNPPVPPVGFATLNDR